MTSETILAQYSIRSVKSQTINDNEVQQCSVTTQLINSCTSESQSISANLEEQTVMASELVFPANHLTNQTLYKLNTTEKSNQRKTQQKQNYPRSVSSYDTRPEKDVSLFIL